ncbi:MATE family efflux transporter [Domibacillus sp. 8LH]|uniref:MATE family efflux transporter n=1 Tax=Domibacillus sp. 8LH TaxID=3073900 RepID=UPI00316DE6B6
MNYKKILVLALPSIASFAAMTATGTINLIMVGNLGALAIAIVGVSNIIMYNVWALFSGIGHTVNYLVAQHYGSNNMKRGVKQTALALYLCVIANILVILTGLFASEAILSLMGSSEDLIREGTGYLTVRFLAMTATVFTFVLHGFFRGIGDTRTPMITSLIGNGIMVFFTYALTYGNAGFPEIGLIGAAWAVLIGECTIFLFSAYVYFIVLHKRYRTRSKAKLDRTDSMLIASESGKLGAEEFSKSMAMFVFTIFVTQLGTNALASNEVALSVMSFGFMPAFAFGTTATILVGQDIGRGNPLSARRMGTETAIIGSIFILVLGLLEFIFADSIIRMYTNDPDVHGLAVQLIQISAFLQLFDAWFNFYAGGLRGIGDTTFLLKISLVLSWLFFVPLTYICTNLLHWESIGAWLALYGFTTVIGIAVLIRFYRVDWLAVEMKSGHMHEHSAGHAKE